MRGIGYQGNKKVVSRSGKETSGDEDYCIYVGRSHTIDFENNRVEARSLLKIGRAKFTTAIQRGRNEGGSDFRIYAKILLISNEHTWLAESIVKNLVGHRRIRGSEGQMELYDITDNEICKVVTEICEVIEAELLVPAISAWIYEDEKTKPRIIFESKLDLSLFGEKMKISTLEAF